MINTLFSVTKYMSHIVLNKIVRMSSNATLDKATPTDRFSVSNPTVLYNLVSCSILLGCVLPVQSILWVWNQCEPWSPRPKFQIYVALIYLIKPYFKVSSFFFLFFLNLFMDHGDIRFLLSVLLMQQTWHSQSVI